MSDRNYLSEMNTLCREAMDGRPPPLVAEGVVGELLARDPELLEGFFAARRVDFLRMHLLSLQHVGRVASRRAAGPARFQAARAAYEAGDVEAFTGRFSAWHKVDEKGNQKQVGEMVGADHVFVADAYKADSVWSNVLAIAHRKVAKKVGDRKTCEVFSEEDYARMFPQRAGSGSAA